MAWLLWHVARQMDGQASRLSGKEPVWTAQGFRDRFDLGPVADEEGMGWQHTPEQARSIIVTDPALLLEHLEAATDALLDYIGTLQDDDLDELVEEIADGSGDAPMTRAKRLVDVITDPVQHLGQAAHVLGMPDQG